MWAFALDLRDLSVNISVIENLLDLLSSIIDEAFVETENLSCAAGISEGNFIPSMFLGVNWNFSRLRTEATLLSLCNCLSGILVHLKSD